MKKPQESPTSHCLQCTRKEQESWKPLVASALLSLFLFASPKANAQMPCATNLPPEQKSFSLANLKTISAKLGGTRGPLQCAANGKEKEAEALKKYLSGLLVIGMPGYNNEKPPFDYMASLQRFVESHGGKFFPLRTHSDEIVERDAEDMCGRLKKIVGHRAVLIGHSKGGATALYMNNFCSGLMEQFDAVILVNAVIQGTEAADFAVNKSALNRNLAEDIQKYEIMAKAVGTASGGATLTTDASRQRLNNLRGKVNRSKVVCVRSSASTAELGARMFDLKATAAAFKGKPNDGLVSYEGQYSSEFCGHEIAISGAHHKALIERDSAEESVSNDTREAFAALLLNKARSLSRR